MRRQQSFLLEAEPLEFWWILRWFGAPLGEGNGETGSFSGSSEPDGYTGFPEPNG